MPKIDQNWGFFQQIYCTLPKHRYRKSRQLINILIILYNYIILYHLYDFSVELNSIGDVCIAWSYRDTVNNMINTVGNNYLLVIKNYMYK